MKYITYYRVSTKKQGQSGLGLESQKAILNHFLAGKEVVQEFTEIESGGNTERAELARAIELCKLKGYTLAVAKVDRLSRITEHALNVFNELQGRIFAADIPNMDKFSLTLYMAMADRERELIKIRTKAALAAKKARGESLGTCENMTAEGRKLANKARTQKASDAKENRQAAELISLYRANGATYQEIADKLNNNGYKTRYGKKFTPCTVFRLAKKEPRIMSQITSISA